jgi:hypothetical protein
MHKEGHPDCDRVAMRLIFGLLSAGSWRMKVARISLVIAAVAAVAVLLASRLSGEGSATQSLSDNSDVTIVPISGEKAPVLLEAPVDAVVANEPALPPMQPAHSGAMVQNSQAPASQPASPEIGVLSAAGEPSQNRTADPPQAQTSVGQTDTKPSSQPAAARDSQAPAAQPSQSASTAPVQLNASCGPGGTNCTRELAVAVANDTGGTTIYRSSNSGGTVTTAAVAPTCTAKPTAEFKANADGSWSYTLDAGCVIKDGSGRP